VHGTIGVVALAAERKLVPSFRDSVSALRGAGLYVSDELVEMLARQLATS
jgi:predicted nucleic acid-binding protein